MSGKDFFQLVSTCDFKKLQKFLQIIPEDDVINYQNNVKKLFFYFIRI